ncbi:MAG TPA: NFACT RNA binding domain-containing protein [bacterium]|nr:NFACT RNA binding domain-containing protein [bacterium]HPS28811.1 NFACT RNA binding domain-containing protein [bacterium]
MFLSELIQVADYINENVSGSIISNIYRSNGGTLFKLYGAQIAGIYFNTNEKVLIPVSDFSLFRKDPITRTEEGLRANFTSRIKRVSVMEKFGKVVRIESPQTELIIPLFKGKGLFIKDISGTVIWSEKKDNALELLKEPMKYFDPVALPQLWEKKFLEEIKKNAELKKEQFIAWKIRKLRKLADNLTAQIEKYKEDIEKFGKWAPLIKANLSIITPKEKMKSIELYDFDGEKKKLDLDPSKTVLENMEIFFSKIRKAKTGIELTDKRLGETFLEIEKFHISADDPEIQQPLINTRKIKQNPQHRPYHEFHAENGKIFLVGKEAKDNDELTFKIASPYDIWFHAKDYHGSHVILKMKKGEELSGTDLLNGCLLAIYYSKAKKGMSGEVWYTERKNVMKKKGLDAGKVIIRNGKVKYINGGVLPDSLKKSG